MTPKKNSAKTYKLVFIQDDDKRGFTKKKGERPLFFLSWRANQEQTDRLEIQLQGAPEEATQTGKKKILQDGRTNT